LRLLIADLLIKGDSLIVIFIHFFKGRLQCLAEPIDIYSSGIGGNGGVELKISAVILLGCARIVSACKKLESMAVTKSPLINLRVSKYIFSALTASLR